MRSRAFGYAAIAVFTAVALYCVTVRLLRIDASDARDASFSAATVALVSAEPATDGAPITRDAFVDRTAVAGRIVDEAGAAIPSARVSIARMPTGSGAASRRRSEPRETEVDETGRFAFNVDPQQSDEYQLTAVADGFKSAYVAAKAGSVVVVILIEEIVPTIEITLKGDAPAPASVRVTSAPMGAFKLKYGRPIQEFEAKVADGLARISGVRGDTVDLIVYADGFAFDLVERVVVGGSTRRHPAQCVAHVTKAGGIVGEVLFEGPGPDPTAVVVGAWSVQGQTHHYAPRIGENFGRGVSPRSSVFLLTAMQTQFLTVRQDKGHWRFLVRGLPEGEYFVGVLGPDSMPRSNVARVSVAGTYPAGPVWLSTPRGVDFLVRVRFRAATIPVAGNAIPLTRGRIALGVIGERGTLFEFLAPGTYRMRPRFDIADAFGWRYSRLLGAVERLFMDVWSCGGEAKEVVVGDRSEIVDFDLETPFARIQAWYESSGRDKVEREALRVRDTKPSEPIIILDDAPPARVGERLLELRRILLSIPSGELGDLPAGFVPAVNALDLEQIIKAMSIPD